MGANRSVQIAVAAGIAVLATVTIALIDARRVRLAVVEENLLWARQVASQASGMAYVARDHGERDPMGWAVSHLGQAEEPRVMRMSVFQAESGSTAEQYVFDAKSGMFDYSRILVPEDGSGVRIKIAVGYRGFLGCRTHATNDGLTFLTGLFCFCLAFSAVQWSARRRQRDLPVAPVIATVFRPVPVDSGRNQLTARMASWLREAKSVFVDLGASIKETYRYAKLLFESVARVERALARTQDLAEAELKELVQARMQLLQIEQSVGRARAAAMTAIIEASRFGAQADSLKQAAEQVHGIAQDIRNQNLAVAASLAMIEAQVRPAVDCVMDARLAYGAIAEAEKGMQAQVGATTRLLKSQVEAMRALDREFEPVRRSA